MRRLAWLSVCLLALLVLTAWLRLVGIPPDPPTVPMAAVPAQPIPDALLAQATIRIAYTLPTPNWLEFNLTGNGQVVRILSNAEVKPDARLPADQEFSYTIRYQLLAAENRLLDEQTYTHRSQVSAVQDAVSGQNINTLFFLDSSDQVAGTRSFLIPLPAATPVRKLRLQLATADPAVSNLAVRAYHQNYPPEQRLDTLWQRLSYSQRERLAERSVHAPALLSQQERRNLVRQEWEPLGPEGTPSQDYIPRQLYVLRDIPEGTNTITGDTRPAPAGLSVGPQQAGVITVPAGGSELQLQVMADPARPALTTTTTLSLLWYPASALTAQRLSFVPGSSQAVNLPAIAQGGVLELVSPQDLTLRAFLQMADNRLEITPQPRRIPAYRLAPGEQLDYPIEQSGQETTPLRIDIRQLLQPDRLALSADLSAATLKYAWLGPADMLIRQGEIRHEPLLSRYDRPVSRDLTGLLSEPERVFLRAPTAAHRLRLRVDRPLLVSLYTRPPQLVHTLLIPEAYTGSDPGYRAQPAWFSRRPAHWRELLQSRRQVWLALQERPPQERPELLTGQYELIDYQPEGQWTGRYLLTARQPGAILQEWSRVAVYRQLAANQTHTLQFNGPPAQPKLTPTLLYQRPHATPFAITLYLDGKKRLTSRLAGRRGQIQLPPITPGQHTLRLQTSSPGQWLLNYAGAEPPAFTKRLSYQLDRQPLQFKYRKQSAGDEVLSLRWHASAADQGRSQLRVSVQGPAAVGTGPLPHWTLRERSYHVAAGNGPPSMVLGTQEQWSDSGQTFFLPLGSDLAAGEYLIRLVLQQGPPGYISVYRLQAGVFAERRLSVEQLFNDQ